MVVEVVVAAAVGGVEREKEGEKLGPRVFYFYFGWSGWVKFIVIESLIKMPKSESQQLS